MTYNVLVRR